MSFAEIIGAIFGLVAIFYIFVVIKNFFDDEVTKLFRRIWSCKWHMKRHSFELSVFQKEQAAEHKLFEWFGVSFKSLDDLKPDAALNIFTAAHKFDQKYPVSRGIVMLDIIWKSFKSRAEGSTIWQDFQNHAEGSTSPYNEAVQEKIENILNAVIVIIGMRKGVAKFGVPYDEVVNGFWDEQDEAEKAIWAREHPNLSGTPLYERFMAEKFKDLGHRF